MNEPKFTKGPWIYSIGRWRDDSPAFGFSISASGKENYVASAGVATPGKSLVMDEDTLKFEWAKGFYSAQEVEANASLIAAAPDLYEACKFAATVFREYEQLHLRKGTPEGIDKAAVNANNAAIMEAALAKASPQ